jgi:NADH:ubiquinone oxidoreductase subunit H
MGLILKTAAFIIGCLAAFYVLYAYLTRFERLVAARLALRGEARYGVAWPLVDTARALAKPDPASPSVRGRVRLAAALLTFLLGLVAWFAVVVAPACAQWSWASLCRVPWMTTDLLAPAVLSVLGSLSCLLQDWPWPTGARAEGPGFRVALQGQRYLLAGVLALAGVFVLSGTTRLAALAAAPRPWIVYQPLGMALAAVSLLLASQRLPIPPLAPEQAPLVGFHMQHGGRTWAWLHLAEGVQLWAVAGLLAVVYLAGPAGPGADGLHWLVLKSALVAVGLVWLKHRWLSARAWRMGHDLWKLLMLLGLANTLLTAALAAALVG